MQGVRCEGCGVCEVWGVRGAGCAVCGLRGSVCGQCRGCGVRCAPHTPLLSCSLSSGRGHGVQEHAVSSRGSLWCPWTRSCTETGDPTPDAPCCWSVCQGTARAGLRWVAVLSRVAQVTASGSGCSPQPQFCLQAPVPSPHTCWPPQPRLLPPPMHIQHSVSLPPMSFLSPLLCIHLLKSLPYVVFHLGFCHLRPVFCTPSSQLAVTHAF